MAKRKQAINPKAGKRLRQLRDGISFSGIPGLECKNTSVSQRKLSDFSGVSVTTISDIERGKAPLTYQIASLLVKAWPDVDIAWIMGESDYIRKQDAPVLTLGKFHHQYDCIIALLNSHGFAVHYDGEHTAIKGPGEKLGGRYAWLTKEEWVQFVNTVNNHVELLLSAYFNEPPVICDLFDMMQKEVSDDG